MHVGLFSLHVTANSEKFAAESLQRFFSQGETVFASITRENRVTLDKEIDMIKNTD